MSDHKADGAPAVPVIVVATPHARHDGLQQRLQQRLTGYEVVRLRSRAELSAAALDALRPVLVFFPHWSWMIPEAIHARFECVIFHMTDLPYGRGGNPLQNLIVRGHEHTMLSALRCLAELDAGPVYRKRPLSLAGTAEDILRRASDLIETMIVDIVENRPTPEAQRGDIVAFARRRPQDGDLAPLEELRQVYDFIRMLDADGYPPAFLTTEHFQIEFRDAQLGEGAVEAKVCIRKRPS